MNIYLDSAFVKDWALPANCPPVQGATTNPSLVYQAGLSVTLATYQRLLQTAADHGLAELMLQLPNRDPQEALQWLAPLRETAARIGVALTIKLPCHADWLPCIRAVQQAGQAVLLTGLSNPVQLLWAQSLKVAFVAPYIGRLVADGRDVWTLMQACVAVQNANLGSSAAKGPVLLAASIKSADVLARLIAVGAGAATLAPANLVSWAGDSLTQAAIEQFDRDTVASRAHGYTRASSD